MGNTGKKKAIGFVSLWHLPEDEKAAGRELQYKNIQTAAKMKNAEIVVMAGDCTLDGSEPAGDEYVPLEVVIKNNVADGYELLIVDDIERFYLHNAIDRQTGNMVGPIYIIHRIDSIAREVGLTIVNYTGESMDSYLARHKSQVDILNGN